MQNPAFYNELINVSETDCEDTNFQADKKDEKGVAPIEIFASEPKENWENGVETMLEKIVSLCGFNLENTKLHHFTNTAQLASAFSNDTTKYILLFCEVPIVKTINFSLNKIGFSTVDSTKVYYNPPLNKLLQDNSAKMRLWNAMKEEFNIQ